METKRLSRRQLGMVAVAAAVPVGSAVAQQAAAAPATDLEAARGKTREAATALRKVKLPQLLEPSLVFRP